MVQVKICGITNLADAVTAAEAGADLLGFIFYEKSRRAVQASAVQGIVAHLRTLARCPLLVGVFVNDSAESVAETLDRCDLDLAQLHGDEVPRLIGDPTSPLYGRSYKALRPASYLEAEADAEWYTPPDLNPAHPALLIDSYRPNAYGGTGEMGDWQMAARLAARTPNLLLAGGLTPENVARAVATVQPWGVDVAGGTEASPGKKDAAKVAAFVQRAKFGSG